MPKELPPHSWYDVLWELDRAGAAGLRPFEIERQMLIAQSNISRLIDRLEEQGYPGAPAVRGGRPRPARRHHAGGARVAPAACGRPTPRPSANAVGRHVSESEAASLARLLTKLADNG